uniref:RRM domain-containing protein n=1 Tax=Mustela putorius furo TaxID=9669 RepID=M3XP43_MUSPF
KASMDYSTYSQAAAQKGYCAYTARPLKGGQKNYGTYGQPTDVSYTQAQSTATYGQTTAIFYGPTPAGYTTPTAPHVYSQSVQGHRTGAYDTTTAVVTTTQASYEAQFAFGPQPSYPAYGQQPAAIAPAKPQDGNKPAETSQPQTSTGVYNKPHLGYGQSNYSYPQVPESYACSQSWHYRLILLLAIPLHSWLTTYDQNSYSQQTPMGSRAQWTQQSNHGQQLPTRYCPSALSPPPNQYRQSSSNYQYQSDYHSSMGVYGQESRSGENQSMSCPDNPGRGRNFVDGGMSRGGRGGGCSGMAAGEQGGFNKPGGPMAEGPDLDLGLLADPHEDSDSSATYVQGLYDNVTEKLADFFKQHGVVKNNKRTRQSMKPVHLHKETGKPKGDATVSDEDPPTAKVAMEWFVGKDFQGSKFKVSLPWKRNGMWGGMPPCEGRGMPLPLCGGPGVPGGSEGPIVTWRGVLGFLREPIWRRKKCLAGDWQCPSLGVETETLPGEQKQRYKVLKPEGFLPSSFPHPPGGGGHCGRGGPGGTLGGRGVLMDHGVPGGVFRGGCGGDRGGFCSGGFGGGGQSDPSGPLGPLMEQLGGRRGGHGGPGRMDKREHHQECSNAET